MIGAVERVLVEVPWPGSGAWTRGDDACGTAARDWLVNALGCAFRALRDPDCAALIGPPVPGATLPLGARVPGTSLELDPASAAFNLGAMIRGPHACAADHVAVVLAAADYAARHAPYEGVAPPTVADLLAALERAAALERGLAADAQCGTDPWLCQRVAGAVVAAALLGGSVAQQFAAAQGASLDGAPCAAVLPARRDERQRRWAAGDNAGRALRHALAALRDPEVAAAARPPGAARGADSGGVESPPAATAQASRLAPPPADAACPGAAFDAAVVALFPPIQAAAVIALCNGEPGFEALAVDQFVARLVRN